MPAWFLPIHWYSQSCGNGSCAHHEAIINSPKLTPLCSLGARAVWHATIRLCQGGVLDGVHKATEGRRGQLSAEC